VTWRDLNRVVFVAAAAVLLWMRRDSPNLYFTILSVTCAVVGSIPIFQEAYESIWQRRTRPAILNAAAVLAALLVGRVLVALVITFLSLLTAILVRTFYRRRGRVLGDSEN
jgi:MFS family permease